jgi:UDP-glucose 4-epimerase
MFDSGPLSGKRIVVIGAGGFLGLPMVEQLANTGASILAISRSHSVANDENVIWVRGDVSDREFVTELFSTFKPEIVFHLTSSSQGGRELSTVLDTLRDDLIATVNVLYGAANASSPVDRLIMTGSLEEPSDIGSAPVSPYAAAKLATSGYGRMFRLVYDLDVRIVRPMMTFGPRQKSVKLVPSTIL